MTEKPSDDSSLDKQSPQVQKLNKKFDQEVADSRDRTKQSGRGEGDNELAKPAGKSGD